MKTICIFLWWVAQMGAVAAALKAASPQRDIDPGAFLRIEAGAHTADIKRISTDLRGDLVLTCSLDKTARLWHRADGRLLRVFRPPMVDGRNGELYSCALSPDGALAAVGGTCSESMEELGTSVLDAEGNRVVIPVATHERRNFVFVYSTATGLLVERLAGPLGNTTDLAFSKTGGYLAGTGGGRGVRVWETATWKEAGRDENYEDEDSYGLDWRGDDRLVSTCLDGRVRLYEMKGTLRLLKARASIVGRQPYGVRFSPDGREIAIGYADQAAIAIVDAQSLELRARPEVVGLREGEVYSVAWSPDGQNLFAAGRALSKIPAGKGAVIRKWGKKGRGQPQDWVLSLAPVSDLRCTGAGDPLFGGSSGKWGEVMVDGTEKISSRSPLAEFAHSSTDFRLPSGDIVHFAVQDLRVNAVGDEIAVPFTSFRLSPDPVKGMLRPDGTSAFHFSVRDRRFDLMNISSVLPGLEPPDTTSLPITAWKGPGSHAPKLGGRPLRPGLEDNEFSHSLAIGPSKEAFFLGTSWNLRKYVEGVEVPEWRHPAPGAVWALNASADGRTVAAACDDGSVRWYHARTGAEVLQLIPIPLGQRWVLVTPDGFYDCSPGADSLLGWFMNESSFRGGYFFPLSCFREVFHRPGVVSRVLSTLDTPEALRLDDEERKIPPSRYRAIAAVLHEMAPPSLELITGGTMAEVSLPAAETRLTVQYRRRVPQGSPAEMEVTARYCGRPATALARKVENNVHSLTVEIPVGLTGELSLHARNLYSFSDPVVLRVQRTGEDAKPEPPKLHIVAVGVGATEEGAEPPLRSAPADADRLAELFDQSRGAIFEKGHYHVLKDNGATTAAIKKAFAELAGSKPGDVAVIYLTTHGQRERDPGLTKGAKKGYRLLTYDSAILGEELSVWLERIPARTLLILDTCHAGAAFGGERLDEVVASANDLSRFVGDLATAELGTAIISSCGAQELGYGDPATGSYLAQVVAEFLREQTGRKLGGTRGCTELQHWVTSRLPAAVKAGLARSAKGQPEVLESLRPSTPVCILPKGVPDFPIAAGK